VVLRPIPYGCRCARQTVFIRGGLLLWLTWNTGQSSILHSAVHVEVLRSAQHRICDVLLFGPSRHTWRSFVLLSATFSMHGGLPHCQVWLSVCTANFLHVWRSSLPARCPHRYARRTSILTRHGRRFVWQSFIQRGICSGLLSCTAQLPVCAADFLICMAVFSSARCSPRSGLPFYPARLLVYATNFLGAMRGVADSS